MSRVALLLRKDALILWRSPLLLGLLLAYPLLIALLVGLVAGYANAKPRVALVDQDGLPRFVTVGGHRFDVDKTINRVSKDVKLVRLGHAEAQRQLRSGKVVAVLTVPEGFISTLKGMVLSPKLVVQTARGIISSRVDEQVQALVYGLNRQLQTAYIGTDLGYVRLILNGGQGSFLGRQFTVLGLDGAELLLRRTGGPQSAKLLDFIHDARLALAQTGNALRATAHPIELQRAESRGRTWALSADVQAYALGLTISFLALVLAAGSLAAERDENVVGRLVRGLVTRGELVWAKVLLAALVALGLGLGVAVVFGAIIQIGNVTGGEPWGRVPLLALGLLLAGAALGAMGAVLGAVSREARTASLVALLVVLPIVFLGLVPEEVVPAAGWISDALPFIHGVRFFSAALYDASPWGTLAREALWLAGLGGLFGLLARAGTRRLLT
ncbi:MAG TPA: ABC transporter permease [Gaiellaceae bacterium]|nr:ABC transporter permease [Gaiellaceae bacterium]